MFLLSAFKSMLGEFTVNNNIKTLAGTSHFNCVLNLIRITCVAAFVIVITIVIGWTKSQRSEQEEVYKKIIFLQRKHSLTIAACCYLTASLSSEWQYRTGHEVI